MLKWFVSVSASRAGRKMSSNDLGHRARRWLGEEARHEGQSLAIAVTAGAIGGGLLIAQALLLAHLIERAIFAHSGLTVLAPMLGALAGVFIMRALAIYVSDRLAAAAALQVKARVRRRLMTQMHALGPAWLTNAAPGELATTVVEGVEALEPYFSQYLPQAALAVVIPAAILVLIFPIDWISGLVLAGTAPLIPVFMVLIGRGAQALNDRQWQKLGRLSAHFFEVLAGLGTLKAFGAGRAEAKLVERLSNEYRSSTMSVLRVAFVSSLALEFLATVGIAMVAVLVGFRLLWGDIAFSAGLAALMLAPEFYLPLRNLGQAYHARLGAVAAAERIAEILDRIPPPMAGTEPFSLRNPPAIAAEKITFRYNGKEPVLHEVTFSVKSGEQLAIVGPSGAGKSTLLYLLLAFAEPEAGQLLVGGRPLSNLRVVDWHRHLAWVPQQPHLFAGTVAENISLGCPGASREDIQMAAEKAQAAAFIDALPKGYDTALGEEGIGISGGECRRIAIARALLRDPVVLVLDEPTASLDAESEVSVSAALGALARNRTVVTVAHRINTVRNADSIVVLDRGRVIAQGSHAQLVETCNLYRNLVTDRTFPELRR